MNILSLFDGMSCGRIALDRAGIEVSNYYASEVDKYAIKVSQANWNETIQLGDVTKWREWGIDWASIDLLIGGSPCQGFSFAGKQLAFDDPRSALFFEYLNILNHIKSVNPGVKFMLENVKMKKEYLEVITSMLKVEPVFINSNLVSAQNRQRYYWANFEVVEPAKLNVAVARVLEDDFNWVPAVVGDSKNRVVRSTEVYGCLTANYYKGVLAAGRPFICKPSKVGSILKSSDNDYRKLTPIECERLQTVPDNYTDHVSNTQRYKMLGNGWTVDVIAHIFRGINAS